MAKLYLGVSMLALGATFTKAYVGSVQVWPDILRSLPHENIPRFIHMLLR